ncbi:atherin-like [Nannospalax galili]|uniref:atherin-like n=1 Tax=Nannospalax galili TaxID=1026970 RepID=UPI0004ED61CA|nr:atherin-like [Nannospalax galili]
MRTASPQGSERWSAAAGGGQRDVASVVTWPPVIAPSPPPLPFARWSARQADSASARQAEGVTAHAELVTAPPLQSAPLASARPPLARGREETRGPAPPWSARHRPDGGGGRVATAGGLRGCAPPKAEPWAQRPAPSQLPPGPPCSRPPGPARFLLRPEAGHLEPPDLDPLPQSPSRAFAVQ